MTGFLLRASQKSCWLSSVDASKTFLFGFGLYDTSSIDYYSST